MWVFSKGITLKPTTINLNWIAYRKLSKSQSDVNVFATDTILATLMCCTRSAYSWDIVVQKIGGKVFLDKRDNTEFGEIYTNLVEVPNVIRKNLF